MFIWTKCRECKTNNKNIATFMNLIIVGGLPANVRNISHAIS